MILKFITLSLLIISSNATCVLKNMRAQQMFKSEGKEYAIITNFENSLMFDVKDRSIRSKISKSLKSKDFFFDVEVSSSLCDSLERFSIKTTFYINNIISITPSVSSLDNFIPCMSFNAIPLGFHLPRVNEMETIVSNLMNISPEKLEVFKFKLLKLISDLDPKTPQANSLLFPAFLFSHLSELGLEKLTQEQLIYIILKVSNGLSNREIQFLDSLAGQIDSISFNKTTKGLNIVLNTTTDTIKILPEDLPYEKDAIELIKDQFNYLKISNGASFNFTTNTRDKIVMNVSGIKGSGSVPVLGNIDFTPNKLTLARNMKTPAKTRIEIEKGIAFNYTVGVDF